MSATVPIMAPPENLWTSQTIIALMGMLIVGGIMGSVMWQGDPQLRSQALVGAIGIGGAISGFYFGNSKGSPSQAAQSAAITTAVTAAIPAAAIQQPGTTTTTTTAPATTTTVVAAAPTPPATPIPVTPIGATGATGPAS